MAVSAMAGIPALKDLSADVKRRMDQAVTGFQSNLASVRTGRASAHMLEQVKIDYYGTPTPVSQMAQISTPEAQLILIQPWDPSVRALAHYPTVVAWMASNMDWTQALGSAFSSDPNSVMDAVQRLRARAQAAGTLATTPQQEVMTDDGEIEIVPAQDNVIYVPVYDPEGVYSGNPYYGYGGPFITFGEPCPAGIWLSYSFDWRSHRVWAGGREHEGWRQPHTGVDHAPPGAHSWHPPTGARAPLPPHRSVARARTSGPLLPLGVPPV